MNDEKPKEPGDSQNIQEDAALRKEAEDLLKAAEERGSWNENPEEDGYWISPDGSIIEIFYNVDYDDPVHADWIRHARKKGSSKDIEEEKDRKK